MPTSDPTAISTVLSAILDLDPLPRRALDVGPGCGKYGFLLREYLHGLDVLDAVDPWPQAMFGSAPALYNTILPRAFPDCVDVSNYDLILMVDVLEHFDAPLPPLAHAISAGARVVLSTPHDPAPQGAYGGNPWETHRSVLRQTDLVRLSIATGAQATLYPHPRQLVATVYHPTEGT